MSLPCLFIMEETVCASHFTCCEGPNTKIDKKHFVKRKSYRLSCFWVRELETEILFLLKVFKSRSESHFSGGSSSQSFPQVARKTRAALSTFVVRWSGGLFCLVGGFVLLVYIAENFETLYELTWQQDATSPAVIIWYKSLVGILLFVLNSLFFATPVSGKYLLPSLYHAGTPCCAAVIIVESDVASLIRAVGNSLINDCMPAVAPSRSLPCPVVLAHPHSFPLNCLSPQWKLDTLNILKLILSLTGWECPTRLPENLIHKLHWSHIPTLSEIPYILL